MSEHKTSHSGGEWLGQMPFTRLFCFRTAIAPGKMGLALIGLIVLMLAGYLMDMMTPAKYKVIVGVSGPAGKPMTELDGYVSGVYREAGSFESYTQGIIRENEGQLKGLLTSPPMNLNDKQAEDQIVSGEAAGTIKQKYQENLKKALGVLAERYKIRRKVILSENEGAQDRRDIQPDQKRRLKDLDYAYQNAVAMIEGKKADLPPLGAINQVVEADSRLKGDLLQKETESIPGIQSQLMETIQLARAYQISSSMQKRGIYATLFDFSMNRFHRAVSDLVWKQDLGGVKNEAWDVLRADCWLMRFHPIFGIVSALIKLAVISVIGGAICRIAALQYTRDERIGPFQALRFSMSRFGSFFTAPLIPMILIAVICGLILAVSLVGAIPAVGEIFTGLMAGLGLIGGFVAALVAIGLIGGYNLMFPTIAVEGSDSFDAISRSFSYILSRPWRMGFYTGVAAVYGAICYLFVRFFAFLTLAILHASVRWPINLDKSSMIPTRGKLDAIWPAPTFGDLFPSINWMTLSGSESIGAVLLLLWVGLVAGLVLAFITSYYFSANTMIYLLLRQRVDATDFEDVYLEEDASDLTAGEPAEPAGEPGEQPKPATPPDDKPTGSAV